MPNINEFLSSPNIKNDIVNDKIETIQQMRPCSKCDLYVDSYQFNNQTMEMYWKCKDGHETKHVFG